VAAFAYVKGERQRERRASTQLSEYNKGSYGEKTDYG
jgi:hypothetical protein